MTMTSSTNYASKKQGKYLDLKDNRISENLRMSKIKTLVYCDLEATGLKNCGRPRITELSLVAVNTESILDLNKMLISHLQKYPNKVEILFPRVMNKLTVCVYPMATIRPEVSVITGLDNYNLSGQATFDRNTGELLNSFLDRLPAPLCLIAHNGDLYDFPLLKSELEKAGINLPSNTLCADSYVGIKEIFKNFQKWRRNSTFEKQYGFHPPWMPNILFSNKPA